MTAEQILAALREERELRKRATESSERVVELARRGRKQGLSVTQMAEESGYKRPYLQQLIGPRR